MAVSEEFHQEIKLLKTDSLKYIITSVTSTHTKYLPNTMCY